MYKFYNLYSYVFNLISEVQPDNQFESEFDLGTENPSVTKDFKGSISSIRTDLKGSRYSDRYSLLFHENERYRFNIMPV